VEIFFKGGAPQLPCVKKIKKIKFLFMSFGLLLGFSSVRKKDHLI
jgi:hypothetical protein